MKTHKVKFKYFIINIQYIFKINQIEDKKYVRKSLDVYLGTLHLFNTYDF